MRFAVRAVIGEIVWWGGVCCCVEIAGQRDRQLGKQEQLLKLQSSRVSRIKSDVGLPYFLHPATYMQPIINSYSISCTHLVHMTIAIHFTHKVYVALGINTN